VNDADIPIPQESSDRDAEHPRRSDEETRSADVPAGLPVEVRDGLVWRRPSVADESRWRFAHAPGGIAVRLAVAPDGAALVLPLREWLLLADAVLVGDFDKPDDEPADHTR
jgi:hypothetical protein